MDCTYSISMRTLVISIAFLISRAGLSQSIGNVYSSRVYKNLEVLEASGVINHGSLSQRPVSNELILDWLNEAEKNAETSESNRKLITSTKELLNQNEPESANRFQLNPLQSISFSQVVTSQAETLVEENGLATVGAIIQPLLSNRQGRFYKENYNAYLETNHSLSYKNLFSLQAQPQLILGKDNVIGNKVRFQKLLFKANLGIAELSIGRDNVSWGMRKVGGLLFSDNAPPLNMIKVSTKGAERFPWFLKNLGTYKFTTLLADLGNRYSQPNAKLAAWRFDYQPGRNWNLAIEHSVSLGGKMVHTPGFYRAVSEYAGFLIRPGDPAPSNHNIATHISKRFNGFTAYVSTMFEDTDANVEMMLIHNATWLFGIQKVGFVGSRVYNFRTELINSGPRAYRHGIYQDGHAINGRLLGFALGPDVWMSNTSLSYVSENDDQVSFNVQYINRSGNSYQVVTQRSGDFIDLEVTDRRPNEQHYIISLNWLKHMNETLNININAGLDYTHNKNFSDKETNLDYMIELRLDFIPNF